MAEGIRVRPRANGRGKSYEAWVYVPVDKTKIRKTFESLQDAKAWRAAQLVAVKEGRMRGRSKLTVRKAWDEWYDHAEKVLEAGGDSAYKPATLRGYRADMENHVLPLLGAYKLSQVTTAHTQELVRRLEKQGLSGSKVRNALVPLRVLFDAHRDRVPVNPTRGLRLPKGAGRRERAASGAEAAALLAALPRADDRALWATLLYGGLRLGEAQALRWRNVHGVREPEAILADEPPTQSLRIDVVASWDNGPAGELAPKSTAGTRSVPCPELLRPYLEGHRLETGRGGDDLVFGRTGDVPFERTTIRRRADRAWEKAGLKPIDPHECRHTYVSLMHAAGIPLERIGDYVGHTAKAMTDRYRHLVQGQAEADAKALDAYLAVRDDE
jgi:integrase